MTFFLFTYLAEPFIQSDACFFKMQLGVKGLAQELGRPDGARDTGRDTELAYGPETASRGDAGNAA